MSNIIKIKAGSGIPTTSDIVDRELAFDRSGNKLYINDSGTIVNLSGAQGGGASDTTGAVTFTAQAGETLSKGDVVYISGLSGNTPIVSKADADDANKMPAFGLASTAASLNNSVEVVTFGILENFDTSSFTQGTVVYVSTTAGSLASSAPAGESSLIQNIGYVVRSHASTGAVKIGGAGRTNATPNLNQNKIFLGNASNQAEATALSSIGLSSFNNDSGFTTNVGDITGVTAGSGLSGGGTSGTVTLSHADTSSQASVDNSGRTYIQDITLDTYGHVTGITSATETVTDTTYSAGSGLDLTGTTFSHTDTSSASNLTASSRTYVTGLTFDTYGHVTGYSTGTETVTDTNTTYSASTGLSLTGTAFSINFKDEDDMLSNSALHAATQQSIKAYVDTKVAAVVDSAPAALDTLNELAAALGDDANFSTTTSTALGNRLRVDTAAQGLTGTQQANAITNLGITATKAELNYVDGVTSNIQTQLNAKQSSTTFTSNGMLSGRTTTSIDTVGDSDGLSINYLSSSATGKPAGTDHSLLTMSYSSAWQNQIAQDWRNDGRMYIRGQNNGTWSSWHQVWSDDDFANNSSNWNTAYGWGNHASAGYLTSSSGLNASNLTSGTVNNARLNTDMQLTSGAPRYRLQESDVTNTPNWWMIADGGNLSFRLNNTGTYPLVFQTNATNDAVTGINLGYSTSITGTLEINNRITSTGTEGFTIGNYANYDRIANDANTFKFITDGNAYANMAFATVTTGTWNGNAIANAYVADLPTSKITSGTFSSARMPASFGADAVTQDNITNRAESGFYQTSTGTTAEGWPITNNSYQHMIATTHSNDSNYFSMQIAGSFYDQNFYGRKTNNSGTQSWVRFLTTADEGTGNGIDADTLDGLHGSSYWTKSGSWAGDLTSNGWTRVQGVSSGGGEFVLAQKSGQISTLIDGSYFAYEGGGFWSSSNSAYGNATGFQATGSDTITVKQADGGRGDIVVTGQIYGGFGTLTTGGTADWNHSSNARAGNGYTLLLGNATNGHNFDTNYYHTLGFEYNSKDGTGNVTQLAIPYTGSTIAFRSRYNGTWGSWYKVLTTADEGSGNGIDADTVDGIQGSSFLRSDAADTFTGKLTGSNTAVCLGYDSGSTNSFQCSNWFRSSGDSGWYNGTWAGGIYMIDGTWVRTYNNRAFYAGGQIASAGDVTAYYSDERLKTKIETIDNAVDKVMSLEGFIYEENELAEELGYTNKGKRQSGVSAQQVEKVLPEAVTLAPFDMETDKHSGEITSKSGENYLTVKYEKLVPLLIQAIKEQQQQINELKEQLNG